METTDDTLQPRAQLNTLPDELKAYIARLCAEADDAAREAFADLSRRFTAKHPLSSEIQDFIKSKLKSSIGALYGTSKRWQQIAAQYRFQHLSLKQLCSERFRFDYGHRLGRFFVSLDLTFGSTTDGYIHLAGALSLLPNLARVKVDDYEGVFRAAHRKDYYHRSHSTYAIESAEAAVVQVLNMATDLSMKVSNLDQISERLSLDALDRLKRLSVQVTTESFGRLIPFLLTTPNLDFLELRLLGDANMTEIVLDSLLDRFEQEYDDISVLPSLRSLKLEYPDISSTILCLAELFSPTLKSLELKIRAYSQDFEVAKP